MDKVLEGLKEVRIALEKLKKNLEIEPIDFFARPHYNKCL